MAVEYKDPSVATSKETPENDCVCPELKLLQSIVVQSSLGQTAMKFMDNFLWTVEKCAEWSLPGQEIVAGDENGKASGKSELVRPLPWVLFLPSLVMLRTIRMTVNVGAFITGYSQVTPSGLVKFLQISRTRLNDIKNSGKKSKDEKSSMNEARRALIKSIRLTLSSLSCLDTSKPTPSPPPTKIHVSSVLDPDTVTAWASTDVTNKPKHLIRDSESEEGESEDEKEETLQEKIDRLALQSSDEDEDFDPADCSVSSDESSEEEDKDDCDASSDNEVDEDDVNVSSTELCNIVEDANVLLDRRTAVALTILRDEIEEFQATERAAAQFFDQRSPAEESRDKVEERLSQRIDSPTCYTPDRSSQEGDPIFYSPISSDSDTPKVPIAEKCVSRDSSLKTNEYANGEIHFISESMISETSKKASGGTNNNGAVVEKRSTNVSKCHKGKRTSHGNRRKK